MADKEPLPGRPLAAGPPPGQGEGPSQGLPPGQGEGPSQGLPPYTFANPVVSYTVPEPVNFVVS